MPQHQQAASAEYSETDIHHAKRVAAVFNIAVIAVLAVVVIFSASAGHTTMVEDGKVGDPWAWMLTPAVDIALAAVLYAASPLRRRGITVAMGVTAEIIFCLLTLILNCGHPLAQAQPEWFAAALHALPVVALVTTTLAASAYQRHYAGIVGEARAAEDARVAVARAERQARLDAQQGAEAERQRLAAEVAKAEAQAAAGVAETERLRIESVTAQARLEADRVRFEAQRQEAVARAESARAKAERSAQKSGSQSGQSRVSSRTPESGDESATDDDRLDRIRLMFSEHQSAGKRQPSVDMVRETLRIGTAKARELHHRVQDEEASRAAARDDQISTTDQHTYES